MVKESKIIERIAGQVIRSKTQENIIAYLRTVGFCFYEFEVVKDTLKFLKPAHSRFSPLIRLNPDGTFDTRLIVLIKMWGKKSQKVIIYKYKAFSSVNFIEWKVKQDINFKKLVVRVKFPDYMNYDQRRKWRAEHDKLKRNPDYQASKYYYKCKPDIEFLETPSK